MASIYKVKKSKFWWAKIYSDSLCKRFSTKTTNKQRALQIAVLHEQKLQDQKFDLPTKTKGLFFDEAAREYLSMVDLYKAKSHYIKQKYYFYSNFIPYFGSTTNVKHIEGNHVINYLEKRKRDAGISDSTANRELAGLKAFFKYAKSKGWIKYNPTWDIKQAKENQSPRKEYTKEESERLLNIQLPGAILFWIIHFASCRPSEALRLRWSDVDFRKRKLTIPSLEDAKTKNRITRELPLHSQLAEKLQTYPRHIKSEYVFCKSNGEKYKDYREALAKICKIAGVENKGLYAMRHSFGTYMAEAGISIEKIKRWMGHKNIKTTMKYIHPIESSDHEMINRHSLKIEKNNIVPLSIGV